MSKRHERQVKWEAMTRQAIQDAVARIVAKRGSHGLTMEQVAVEAGVAKGSLYLHFKSKQALLESVKESSLEPLLQEAEAILDSAMTPQEKIEQVIARRFSYFDQHRELFRFLLEDRQVAQLHSERMKNSRYRYLLEKMAGVVEAGIGSGEFRAMDARKVAAMLLEASIAVIGQRLWDEAPGPWEEDARILIDVFLRGIAAGQSNEERDA